MNDASQRLLRGPGPLLLPDGSLADVGWARQPVLDANLENTRTTLPIFQWARIKRWDYYGVITPTHFFSFTLADIGYAGMVFAYVIDLASKQYHEETLTIPLARGVHIPRSSEQGTSRFSNGKTTMEFEAFPEKRRISVHWQNFNGHDLRAEVELALPQNQESMVIVIPIQGKRYYYNRKVNCMPASGWVEYSGTRHALSPEDCLGNLDWGRGVWEYRSFWVWASASGYLPDCRTIGLNLGFGFGDNSAATENAVILNGRVHKLGQVDFQYDPRNFTGPWRMCSPDGRLDLTFQPFFERVASTDLKIIASEVHQMFGRYSGTVITDDGERIVLENLVGFAEEHNAKW